MTGPFVPSSFFGKEADVKELCIEISDYAENERIDKYLSVALTESEGETYSRSAVTSLIEDGNVLQNGVRASKSNRVKNGDLLLVRIPSPEPLEVTAEEIPLDIVYEDDDLLVVNKCQGMVVHPAAGNEHGTLVNALLFHCKDSLSGINGVMRPGIVHRIDKDTSGLLIVAKTNRAHLGLAAQIKEHSFLREYQAIVIGRMKELAGTVNAPIGRDDRDRKKMAVTLKNSKQAVTHYEVLEEFPGYSHMKFRLETGRTHQIRVHMSNCGHAIVGDPLYAPKNSDTFGLVGQCLHAKKIGFIHPITQDYLEFDSELPEHFQRVLSLLRRRT